MRARIVHRKAMRLVDARCDPCDLMLQGLAATVERAIVGLVGKIGPTVLPREPHSIRLTAKPALGRILVVVARAMEHHQGSIGIEMGAIAVADGLQGQMCAAVGDQRIARIHLVRPSRTGRAGDVLHVPGFRAAFGPHKIVCATALVHVRAFRIRSGDAPADALTFGQHGSCGDIDA